MVGTQQGLDKSLYSNDSTSAVLNSVGFWCVVCVGHVGGVSGIHAQEGEHSERSRFAHVDL